MDETRALVLVVLIVALTFAAVTAVKKGKDESQTSSQTVISNAPSGKGKSPDGRIYFVQPPSIGSDEE